MAYLTKEELGKISKLTDDIDDALKVRTDYLEQLKDKYAKAKVGDRIFNERTGDLLGVCSKVYRYTSGHNFGGYHDSSVCIHYEYEKRNGFGKNKIYDNTSRQEIGACAFDLLGDQQKENAKKSIDRYEFQKKVDNIKKTDSIDEYMREFSRLALEEAFKTVQK